jgi:hypothetical protein
MFFRKRKKEFSRVLDEIIHNPNPNEIVTHQEIQIMKDFSENLYQRWRKNEAPLVFKQKLRNQLLDFSMDHDSQYSRRANSMSKKKVTKIPYLRFGIAFGGILILWLIFTILFSSNSLKIESAFAKAIELSSQIKSCKFLVKEIEKEEIMDELKSITEGIYQAPDRLHLKTTHFNVWSRTKFKILEQTESKYEQMIIGPRLYVKDPRSDDWKFSNEELIKKQSIESTEIRTPIFGLSNTNSLIDDLKKMHYLKNIKKLPDEIINDELTEHYAGEVDVKMEVSKWEKIDESTIKNPDLVQFIKSFNKKLPQLIEQHLKKTITIDIWFERESGYIKQYIKITKTPATDGSEIVRITTTKISAINELITIEPPI